MRRTAEIFARQRERMEELERVRRYHNTAHELGNVENEQKALNRIMKLKMAIRELGWVVDTYRDSEDEREEAESQNTAYRWGWR